MLVESASCPEVHAGSIHLSMEHTAAENFPPSLLQS